MKRMPIVFLLILFVVLGHIPASGQSDKRPFKSAVPKYTFSTTLEEQEDEIQSNPVIQRFAESREKLSEDPYRPIYHFSSPEGRLGDPNGLCFWQGNWHLFYQAWPHEDQRQHWGHTISKDLIHWKDLPYAIYPGPEIKVYSGSTLVEDNRVIAMYHGTGEGNMIAVSDDPLLLNWHKIFGTVGNAVIPTRSKTGFPLPYSVFDPCIWKRDSVYYSLSGGKTTDPSNKTTGQAYLFRSLDLKNWEYMHPFVEGDQYSLTGDDYACPYFWPIGDRHILYFFSHMSGGQFLLGDLDTAANIFHVTSGSGHGGIGPPTATPDGKGGVVVMANIRGYFSLPRLITLLKDDEVGQEPAGDISALRYNAKSIENVRLPKNKEVVLRDISGNAMEISAEIDMKNSEKVELKVLRSAKKEEYTKIIVYKAKGYNSIGLKYIGLPGTAIMPDDLVPLFENPEGEEPNLQPLRRERVPGSSLISIDTEHSSLNSERISLPLTLPFLLNPDETVKLRIFIDKSIIEVFVNGRQALCTSVRPSQEDSKGVSIRSQGNDAELLSLEAWQMKHIYSVNRGPATK
jgi:beta-fructofuranosidase